MSDHDRGSSILSEKLLGSFHAVYTPPARIVSSHPCTFRQAVYPNGELVLQGGYSWSEGYQSGVEWRELPVVLVDAQGVELPMQPEKVR
jgi:hypothetical protein